MPAAVRHRVPRRPARRRRRASAGARPGDRRRSCSPATPLDAILCDGATLDLDAGTHRITTGTGAISGLHVDRVVLAAPDRPSPTAQPGRRRPSPRAGRARAATSRSRAAPTGAGWCSARASTSRGRRRRRTATSGHRSSSTAGSTGGGSSRRANRSTVSIRWTAQRPLTIALVLTVLAVLACIALVAVDRRPLVAPACASPASPSASRRCRSAGAGSPAARGSPRAARARRPWMGARRRGGVGGARARPRPAAPGRTRDDGDPDGDRCRDRRRRAHRASVARRRLAVRFEWLHGLGLFAAVSLAVVAFAAVRSPSGSSADPRRTGRTSSPPTPG